MKKNKNPLQEALDHQKFLHAADYAKKESKGLKKLTTSELARTNTFLTGNDEPWRFEITHVQIPGGQIHKIDVISNPMNRVRDLISSALQLSGNGQGLEGAAFIYSQLVLEHHFKDANRRTAVIAALWVLLISGYDCDAEKLLQIPIGDLRSSKDLADLPQKIKSICFNH